jgi:hypothetical protein
MNEFVIMTKGDTKRIVNPYDDKLMRLCINQGYVQTGCGIDAIPALMVEAAIQQPVRGQERRLRDNIERIKQICLRWSLGCTVGR